MSSEPRYRDHSVTLWHGDCLDVIAELPDASVDAVVTDPPYGLGFMGKAWDALPPGREWAEACLRVLKPGGHLIAFGGSRTWHRLAVAVEDAGFELRDSIAWLYGSGFPKSLDVSKAIDKRRDDVDDIRAVCRWVRAAIDAHPTQTVRSIAERFNFHPRMVEHWAARDTDSQPSLPTLEQWDALRDALDLDDSRDREVLRLNLRKGEPGEAWADRPVTGTVDEWENRTSYALTSRDGLRRDTPATDAAQQWQGWGTALKPAFEPIVVGRKPLDGTVAANVLRHGVGALNIDACRVDADPADRFGGGAKGSSGFAAGYEGGAGFHVTGAGRWPTNVALDDTQAAELDRDVPKAGAAARASGPTLTGATDGTVAYGARNGLDRPAVFHADSGGASRFFPVFRYQAKAPKRERPNVDGVTHPTVKPLDLMRWLVRLVTPPGGVVLEPFAGSGATVEACQLEGVRCIAIEREADYLPLILSRLRPPWEVAA